MKTEILQLNSVTLCLLFFEIVFSVYKCPAWPRLFLSFLSSSCFSCGRGLGRGEDLDGRPVAQGSVPGIPWREGSEGWLVSRHVCVRQQEPLNTPRGGDSGI